MFQIILFPMKIKGLRGKKFITIVSAGPAVAVVINSIQAPDR